MENRNHILNELREIGPVVAGIGQQNPYTVPTGYFEGLAEQMLQLVKANETPVLPQATNPYQVPQGYFEGLADSILQRVKARETVSAVLPSEKKNPYQVPQGYFEGLADTILQKVTANEEVLSPVLLQAKQNPYQVPQGYFEGLADTILQRVTANEEEVLSPVLLRAKNNPYEVPQDYFNNLPQALLNRVKAEEAANAHEELEILSPLLSGIGKKTPFSMPAGYFEDLSENAMAGAQAIDFVNDELENLSPLMSSLRTKQVYEVPAGYFEQLPQQIIQATNAQQPAKVIKVSFTRRVMRYAVAAVVAGIIGIAGYVYQGHNGGGDTIISPPPTQPSIAKADLDSVSDEMLEKYLENQTAAPAEIAAAATASNNNNVDIAAADVKDMLADVSDEDLQQYLDKYSTIKEKEDIQTN
jgi:hypothetical protein